MALLAKGIDQEQQTCAVTGAAYFDGKLSSTHKRVTMRRSRLFAKRS